MVSGYNSLANIVLRLLLSEDVLAFKNSVDPDEMQHYDAFHLGLHCLQKNPMRI